MLASKKRLRVVLFMLLGLMGFMIFRVGYWSLIKGEWLQSEAEMQWVSNSKVEPKRGDILDRNMNVLAQSAASDTVVIIPEQVQEPEQVASVLSSILKLDYNEVFEKVSTKKRTDDKGNETKIGEVWLKRQISHEISEEINSLDLEGVKLVSDVKRYYPNNEFATQLIGYTDVDGVGQTGIEKRYNGVLEGRQGLLVAETDPHSNDIPNGKEMYIPPEDGNNVVLTIDEVAQSFLETTLQQALDELQPESVQGVLMDVQTGEILSMANLPEFDLNNPPRTDSEQLMSLSSNVVSALPNEPGSVFSIFPAVMAMDAGVEKDQYMCTGATTVEGEQIMCTGAHGAQSYDEAVINNCAVAASTMAADVGVQSFYHYLHRFGFGEKTGIDFTADSVGDVMSMKYAAASDIAKMAVGENIEVTLLQLANAMASLVNDGDLYVPRLVAEFCDNEGEIVETNDVQTKGQSVGDETSVHIRHLLAQKAEKNDLQLNEYRCGSITGVSNKYDKVGTLLQETVNSTYVGFAPADDPQFLVLIHLEGIEKTEDADHAAMQYGLSMLQDTLKFYHIEPDETVVVKESEQSDDQMITVPDVERMGHKAAKETLQSAGLNIADDGSGTVVTQEPAAGEQVQVGAEIFLYMDYKRKVQSEEVQLNENEPGIDSVTVPDFLGLDIKGARSKALSSGVRFFVQGEGIAKRQYPVPGTKVQRGADVTVTFKLKLPNE